MPLWPITPTSGKDASQILLVLDLALVQMTSLQFGGSETAAIEGQESESVGFAIGSQDEGKQNIPLT